MGSRGTGNDSRLAVVTGATSGIGRSLVFALAEQGWTVLLGCRNLDSARSVAAEINALPCEGKAEVGPSLDFKSLGSIRDFVKKIEDKPKIDLLVNNAGTNYEPQWFSDEGVPALSQVNYVGHYLLTRLLLPKLKLGDGPRIVNVSSIMHRFASIRSVHKFLTTHEEGTYANSKLAIVLFTKELQHRLGKHSNIQCLAVDPGAVNTPIFSNSLFSNFPFNQVLNLLYSPPQDGCRSVLFASTSDPEGPETGQEPVNSGGLFLARGLFASPLVVFSWEEAFPYPVLKTGAGLAHKAIALVFSLLDYPIRRVTGHRWQSQTAIVPCSRKANDEALARQLWDATAELVDLPKEL